ncbi:MAG: imidazolonepropionase, partial [Pseudomonas sp.]
MTTLWCNCHVATMVGGQYSIIRDAAIVTTGNVINWLGPQRDVSGASHERVVDLGGAWVTPGLVDCHTHTIFAGDRSAEFERRLEGVSYEQIAAEGGGIASTVRATRAATEQELFDSASRRVRSLLRDGVTTLELKSGYGLELEAERRILIETTGAEAARPRQAMKADELLAAQRLIRRLPVGDSVVDAILDLVRSARPETA